MWLGRLLRVTQISMQRTAQLLWRNKEQLSCLEETQISWGTWKAHTQNSELSAGCAASSRFTALWAVALAGVALVVQFLEVTLIKLIGLSNWTFAVSLHWNAMGSLSGMSRPVSVSPQEKAVLQHRPAESWNHWKRLGPFSAYSCWTLGDLPWRHRVGRVWS